MTHCCLNTLCLIVWFKFFIHKNRCFEPNLWWFHAVTLACDARWHAAGCEVADGLSWTSTEALLLCLEPDDDEALLSVCARWIHVETLRIHGRLIKAALARRWDSSLTFISTPGSFLFWLVISQCCFQRKIIIIYHRNLSDLFWLENNDSTVAIIHSVFIFAAPIRLACLRRIAIHLVIQMEQQLQQISDKVGPNSWNME